MKKWFFSTHGKVTSALSFEEAKEFLRNNPKAYGWNASFKQWRPVNCISEFVGIIPAAMPLPLIPKEVSSRFRAKKQSLESQLVRLENNIKNSLKALVKFEQQIQDYKDLTNNLNDNVKGAIENIERKHTTLSKKVTHLTSTLNLAKTEMLEVVERFNRNMQSNDILMPVCIKPASVHYLQTETTSESSVGKLKLAQDKLVTPLSTAEVTPLTNNSTQFNDDNKSTLPSETITKVYRGVEYQVQK